MTQQDFQKIHQRVKNYHILNNSKHGFELKINSKWQYDDIEYDIKIILCPAWVYPSRLILNKTISII